MEYLEGQTLAERREKGALPLDQALQYAIQIADALDKAHRKGIVHRDLKPGNVMLTKSGVKLLDFGLAKLQPAGAVAGLSVAATMAGPLTGQGAILGTLHYMAPEQVEGREADARSDMFSFGALVYEMATGKRAFEGKSAASVMAAILEREPPAMSSLQPLAPPALDHVVSRCLAKDPDDRWQSASDVMRELKWIAEVGSRASVAALPPLSTRPLRVWQRPVPLAAGIITLIVTLIVATGLAVRALMRPSPEAVVRFPVLLGADETFSGPGRHIVAISPAGTHLVYTANSGLSLRRLDQLHATPLAGTEVEARSPFFSPDGQWIGFYAAGQLKRVAVTGGAPVTVGAADNPWGASWGADDMILYGQGAQGIWRVPGTGGIPERLISGPGVGHLDLGPRPGDADARDFRCGV
jgi:hypothetical protein